MNEEKKTNADYFKVLREVHNNKNSNQRKLANSLGFSLGKLNYCLIELKKKGLVKINNFAKKKDKVDYAKYILTRKGIAYRVALTIKFMKIKFQEYDQLKKEINKFNLHTLEK
jgi:EPS-associated MarR family transcriptional regulator